MASRWRDFISCAAVGPGMSLLELGGGLPAAESLVIRLKCPADGAYLSHAACGQEQPFLSLSY